MRLARIELDDQPTIGVLFRIDSLRGGRLPGPPDSRGAPDAADWTRRLCDGVLKDEKGVALSGASTVSCKVTSA
jgi:hypothetical protein